MSTFINLLLFKNNNFNSFLEKKTIQKKHIIESFLQLPLFNFNLKFEKKLKLRTKRRFRKTKRLFVKQYIIKKTCKPSRNFYLNKIKIPFSWNNLNFVQSNFISNIKDTFVNPFFGGIRKGTFKGFIFGGIKEYVNRFLLPRWYRVHRFMFYKKYWKQNEKNREFFLNYRQTSNFFFNIFYRKNIKFICQYYIRKRWDLIDVFRKNRIIND